MTVFAPLAFGAVRFPEFAVLEVLSAILLVLWVVRMGLAKDSALFWPRLGWLVVVFAGYTLWQYFRADVEYTARRELFRVLVCFVAFVVVLTQLNRQEHLRLIALTVFAVASLMALVAIYQFVAHPKTIWGVPRAPAYLGRGSGTFVNPNHLAGYLEMVLPMGVSLSIMGRFGPAARVTLGYFSGVILVGIGATVSRGGVVGCLVGLVGLVLWLVLQRRWWKRGLIFAGIMAVVGGGVWQKSSLLQDRFLSLQGRTFEQVDTRHFFWNAAWSMWRDHPWFGVGPGHFAERFREYRLFHDATQVSPEFAHNDYLNTLADWGGVGFLWLMLTAIAVAITAGRTWPALIRTSDIGSIASTRLALLAGAFFGLLAIAVHSFVDFSLQIPANALMAVTLAAVIVAHRRFVTDAGWIKMSKPVSAFLSIILLGFAFALVWESVRGSREWWYLKEAANTHQPPQFQFEALLKAAELEPANAITAYRLGEMLRAQSFAGDPGYELLARQAMEWFQRAIRVNPHDAYSYLRYGMCLDWLGRHQESAAHFRRAVELDPNGYFTSALLGWHYYVIGDYVLAKIALEKSLKLRWRQGNPIAENYHDLVMKKLTEASVQSGK